MLLNNETHSVECDREGQDGKSHLTLMDRLLPISFFFTINLEPRAKPQTPIQAKLATVEGTLAAELAKARLASLVPKFVGIR